MSIVTSIRAAFLASTVSLLAASSGQTAPLPTNVAAIKSMAIQDTVQVQWRGWGPRGGWGYRGGGYRGWGHRGLGWGAAAVTGALIGGAIASQGFYGGPYYGYAGYPYYGAGYAYGGCSPYGGYYGRY